MTSSAPYSAPVPSPDASFARLVLDAADTSEVPRLRPAEPVAAEGALSCSGSAQFSAGGWRTLRAEAARRQPASFVVVDLRKESHGFLNGAAVSWYAAVGNWGCAGLSPADAAELERLRLVIVANSPQVSVGTKALVQSLVQLGTPGGDTWDVQEVSDERQLVEAGGDARYVRIGIDDHCPPDAAALAALSDLFDAVPAGTHLHFHCRGGKGRTSTAMALLDMHQHAGDTPFTDIVRRQAERSGYALDRDVDDALAKSTHLRERWAMLQRFYSACAERNAGKRRP